MNPESQPNALETKTPQSHTTRKHIRGSSMLLVGRMISLALNLGVQVLTVRYLTKGEYGAFAYALNFASIGTSVSLLSLDKALSRYLPIYDENKEHPSLFGAILLTLFTILGIGLALGIAVIGFQGLIEERVVNDRLAVSLLLILIWLSPIQAVDNWFQSMFAVFIRVKAIFFRRYILGPGMKLAAVLIVTLSGASVYTLAWGYLIGGILGISIYASMLTSLVREKPVFREFNLHKLRFPVREIFGFSTPLVYSDVVFILRNNLTIVLLGFFHVAAAVAEFRSVVPVARLNEVVLQSFTFLYTPMAARMYARHDEKGINDLYWQTAVWISIMSFPMFVVSFALAKPVTVLLFSARYEDSSTILALLALSYYFHAALGFNAHTLRVYGRIKYIVIIDFLAMCTAIVLNLLLIPPYGALGAAMSASGTLVVHSILNHIGLLRATSIRLFEFKYLYTYLTIILGAGVLLLIQAVLSPPIYVGLPLAGLASLAIVLINRSALDIAGTFPELLKLPLMKRLFLRSV